MKDRIWDELNSFGSDELSIKETVKLKMLEVVDGSCRLDTTTRENLDLESELLLHG